MSLYCEICGKPIINRTLKAKTCSPECSKKLHNIYLRKRYKKLCVEARKKVFEHYGNKCSCCGESTKEFLVIDHIHGDAHKKGRWCRSGAALYIWIVRHNYPDDFQVLCVNCNHVKKDYDKRFCSIHHPELYK